MKVRVVREFIDKHTSAYYRIGSDYESSNAARITELQEAGFVERVSPPAFEEIPEAVETAVEEAPENAMQPRHKRRK